MRKVDRRQVINYTLILLNARGEKATENLEKRGKNKGGELTLPHIPAKPLPPGEYELGLLEYKSRTETTHPQMVFKVVVMVTVTN